MNVLVVGLGSIGQRHARNLRELRPDARITALRREGSAASEPVDEIVTSWEAAAECAPTAAVIASPASLHVEHALRALALGAGAFVEKPLAVDAPSASPLEAAASELPLMIAYPLRFHRPLQVARELIGSGRLGELHSIRAEVGMYLPDWRPDRDYRQTPSASRALGGGALLELSHELDLVRWLAGEVASVLAACGKRTALEIDVEDQADLLLRFESGAIGSVHLDMAQRVPFRGLRVAGSEGTMTWEWETHELRVWSADRAAWHVEASAPADRNAMYLEEMRHFLECLETGIAPAVGLEDGLAVLRVIDAARRASREGRWIDL